MRDYDGEMRAARRAITDAVISMDLNKGNIRDVARATDNYELAVNRALEALVRQCTERDREISRLLSELAEAKHRG